MVAMQSISSLKQQLCSVLYDFVPRKVVKLLRNNCNKVLWRCNREPDGCGMWMPPAGNIVWANRSKIVNCQTVDLGLPVDLYRPVAGPNVNNYQWVDAPNAVGTHWKCMEEKPQECSSTPQARTTLMPLQLRAVCATCHMCILHRQPSRGELISNSHAARRWIWPTVALQAIWAVTYTCFSSKSELSACRHV